MATLNAPSGGQPYAIIEADRGETPLDIDQTAFISAYKQYGALLLRGFSIDFDIFRQLTTSLCSASVFNESRGREVLDAENNIQTVNIGVEAFPLHPELSREPWKPDICFFWCMSPPGVGGETTVCDGVEIVKHMSASTRAAFASRRLRYIAPAPAAVCEYWLHTPTPDDGALEHPPADCPYEFGRAGGRVLRAFTRPALHKPMFSNELAFGNFLLFARYLKNMRNFPMFEDGDIIPDDLVADVKAVCDALISPVNWRSGDIVILDNTRFMHGRNAVTNLSERRIATYFGYLKFAVPDPEEGPDPRWRRAGFRPPFEL